MSADRELLELAAKAAGIGITWTDTYRQFFKDGYELGQRAFWNPLTDDGDALRLAVKLEIAINPFAGKTVVAHTESNRLAHEKWECWDEDPYAATRHSIVKVAADIGRSLTLKNSSQGQIPD